MVGSDVRRPAQWKITDSRNPTIHPNQQHAHLLDVVIALHARFKVFWSCILVKSVYAHLILEDN